MVRSGLVCLKTLARDAQERGKIPIREALAFKVPKTSSRDRRIDEWETRRILEAGRDIGDVRSDIYEVLVRMGKRKEEIAEISWEEVDFGTRHWKLPASRNKSGRPHLILLPRQVVAIMARQQPDPAKRTGPVFTLNGTTSPEMGSQVKDLLDANLHRRVELANAAEGLARSIAQYTVHDQRKIPSSRLAEAPFSYGNDLINAMLLHSTGDALDDVYILTKKVAETGEMVQRWNDHLDELMSSPTSWPGGRDLPEMRPAERLRRIADLRKGWPLRADQKRAVEARKADPDHGKRRRRKR